MHDVIGMLNQVQNKLIQCHSLHRWHTPYSWCNYVKIYISKDNKTNHSFYVCIFTKYNLIWNHITYGPNSYKKNKLTINTMEVCKLYNIIQISICLINKFCLKTGTNIAKWLSKMIGMCQSNSIGISFVWKKSSQLLLRWTYSLIWDST